MPAVGAPKLVFDSYQAKPLRRSGGACQRPVVSLKNSCDVYWLQFPSPDLDQRAHDIAHHVVKKTIASDFVDQHTSSGAAENAGGKDRSRQSCLRAAP